MVQRRQQASFDASGDVYGLVFSPDGKTLASADGGKHVILWDVAGQKRLTTLIGHTAGITRVVFSPDGHTLAASADKNTKVLLWDIARNEQLTTLFPLATGEG